MVPEHDHFKRTLLVQARPRQGKVKIKIKTAKKNIKPNFESKFLIKNN